MGECYKNEVEPRGIMRLLVGKKMDEAVLEAGRWDGPVNFEEHPWGLRVGGVAMEGVLRMRIDEFEVWGWIVDRGNYPLSILRLNNEREREI
jgi:hypothetical protein